VVIPEFGARAGYQMTPGLRAFVGYTILDWGEVVRAGNQIDETVNTSFLPPATRPVSGPSRPAARLAESSFCALGISLGLELNFGRVPAYQWACC
jgi:hypothetical protein